MLRTNFTSEIERDPRGFRMRLLRLLRFAFPVKNGRPRMETVTRATEMRRQGKSWREVYAACIAAGKVGDSLSVAQCRLRSAVRARQRTRRHKASRLKDAKSL